MSDEHKQIDGGGPAYPASNAPEYTGDGCHGMSLRDYFAAKAMQAEMITTFSDATPQAAADFSEAANATGRSAVEHLAFNAYIIADAMLAARKGGAS